MLWFSTFAASGLISVYVLAVAWFNSTAVDADPLERAAYVASDELIHTTVTDNALGDIGIRDIHGELAAMGNRSNKGNKSDIRSYNTVATLLREARIVADRYDLTVMAAQSASDLDRLNKLKKELGNKLQKQVSPGGATYERLKKILARNVKAGDRLKKFEMALMVVDDPSVRHLFDTGIEALPSDSAATRTANGKLKAMVPLSRDITLHQTTSQAVFVSPALVKAANSDDIPTIVLLKVQYEKQTKNAPQLHSRAIAIICGQAAERSRRGAKFNQANLDAALKKEGTCLVLNFPQGRPDLFTSLSDLFKSKKFTGRGEWQQATAGSVPGPGNLAPPVAPVLTDMTARDSLGLVFYHWLRQLNVPVSDRRLIALIEAPWQKNAAQRSKTSLNLNTNTETHINTSTNANTETETIAPTAVNSCIAAESEARAFAFLHQTAPQEAGQKALAASFAATAPAYPSSAIPITIDSHGAAITPGRSDFDRAITTDLLSQIYATNLAAQDTIATARLVELGAHRAFRDIRDRINLHQADLGSLKDRMRKETDPARDKEIATEIAALETNLSYAQLEQKRLAVVLAFAHTARNNGISVANQSFDLSSRLFQVCRTGIHRLDSIPGAFLLGKRFIFRPQLESLSESQLFDYSRRAASSNNASSDVSWLQDKLLVFGKIKELTSLPELKVMAEGRSAADLLAEEPPVVPAAAETIVYDSRALYNAEEFLTGSSGAPLTLLEYPFKGLTLNVGQLVYYAQKACSSDSDMVSWSTLTRDFAAARNESTPPEATTLGWSPFGTCPRLAAEWQLRAPLLLLDAQMKDALKGATLTDPKTDQRMPVVPPADTGLF